MSRILKDIRFAKLPAETIDLTKRVVLDFIGSAAAGSTLPGMKDFAKSISSCSNGSCTYVTASKRVAALEAAFVNAAFSFGYDTSDIFWSVAVHPSGPVVAAALAAGEMTSGSGKRFIESVVTGYDATYRIAMALNIEKGHTSRRFAKLDTSELIGIFGAFASASRMLNLTLQEMSNGFAMAGAWSGSHSDALYDEEIPPSLTPMRMGCGKAAMLGVMAALAAKAGLKASVDFFEGRFGAKGWFDQYCGTLFGSPMTPRFDELIKARRGHCWIHEIMLKRFPICACKHAPMDAFLQITKGHKLKAEDIDLVEVRVTKYREISNLHRPKNQVLNMLWLLSSCALNLCFDITYIKTR